MDTAKPAGVQKKPPTPNITSSLSQTPRLGVAAPNAQPINPRRPGPAERWLADEGDVVEGETRYGGQDEVER